MVSLWMVSWLCVDNWNMALQSISVMYTLNKYPRINNVIFFLIKKISMISLWMVSWLCVDNWNMTSQLISVIHTLNKYPRIDNVTDAYLWYCRLSHINTNRINRLTKEGIFDIDDYKLLPTCESYLFGRMTKSPFIEKDERVSDILGLIYSDVCRPINICARGGYYYFITLTNDLSRYGYVYIMKHKFESFKIFKWFHNKVKK